MITVQSVMWGEIVATPELVAMLSLVERLSPGALIVDVLVNGRHDRSFAIDVEEAPAVEDRLRNGMRWPVSVYADGLDGFTFWDDALAIAAHYRVVEGNNEDRPSVPPAASGSRVRVDV